MRCVVLDSGKKGSQENMDRDASLLEGLAQSGDPILHLYDWQGDAATYGHFVDPYLHLKREGVERSCLQLAKRPTGGGIVFHTCDLAFSFLMPATHPDFVDNPLANYHYVNQKVMEAISKVVGQKGELDLHCPASAPLAPEFCMAKPTKYDVMLGGKKVGGAAQRKTRAGYLHQGSIFLTLPSKEYLFGVIQDERVCEAFFQESRPLLTDQSLQEGRGAMKEALKEAFCS